MRSRFLLALSIALSFSATAQEKPVITAVVPASGPVSGGIQVTILGSGFGLPPGFACILPCPPTVTFGGEAASLVRENGAQLVVFAPPHAEGSVDVTVKTGDGRSATAARAFTYQSTTRDNYEMILLPVYLDAPVAGQSGSIWKTDFWLRNNGTQPVSLAPWPCPEGSACPAVYPLTRTLQPGESIHSLAPFPNAPQPPAGRVVYVSRGSNVSAQLRVGDVSRGTLDSGTELPVIREDEWLTTTAQLLNVPRNDRNRITVRVYTAGAEDAKFRILVVPQEGDGAGPAVVIADVVVNATSADHSPFSTQAGVAQFDVPLSPSAASVRIQVEPLSAGGRFWAFASVTNNETQHVTLVTPQ
jgi:hypothetical protein